MVVEINRFSRAPVKQYKPLTITLMNVSAPMSCQTISLPPPTPVNVMV